MHVSIDEAADSGMRSIEHLANYQVLNDSSTGETYSLSDCAKLFDKLAAKGCTPTLPARSSSPSLKQ